MLSGRAPKTAAAARRRRTPRAPAPRRPAPPRRVRSAAARTARSQTLTSSAIQLVAPGGKSLQIGVRTELGKALLRPLRRRRRVLGRHGSASLERLPDGQWIVTPVPGTVNETLVNGAPLTAPRAVAARAT